MGDGRSPIAVKAFCAKGAQPCVSGRSDAPDLPSLRNNQDKIFAGQHIKGMNTVNIRDAIAKGLEKFEERQYPVFIRNRKEGING